MQHPIVNIRTLGQCALALFLLVLMSVASAQDIKVNVGVLKFGTVNWELNVIKNAGLDKNNGIDVVIVPFASSDATKIALQTGAVDIIVTDWLWVSRQRADNVDLTFSRYSSAVGSLMVAPQSGLRTLHDLTGKKIGVAGGPLDKSWILLQGMMKEQHGIDLAAVNEIVFGAPPLLAEKTISGELDANLNYWHYSARLESQGFKRLISVEQVSNVMGASGPLSSLGYVFDQKWAAKNPHSVTGFIKASMLAKGLMKSSNEEWVRMSNSGVIKDSGVALTTMRDRFREGIPVRPLKDEIRDAKIIYRVLAKAAGGKLVGDSAVLVDGTYWDGAGDFSDRN